MSSFMVPSPAAALAALLLCVASCSGSPGANIPLDAGGDAGVVPRAGDPVVGPLGAGTDSDGGGGRGTSGCNSPLNAEACACSPGSPARNCYLGPAAQAGVGSCAYGHQTCISEGESGGVWGACLGSGAPTATCASQGAECGMISDGCGGMLSCGTCPAGQSCGGGGKASGSVGNVCGAGACAPTTTCQSLGYACGAASDDCGNPLDCGSCADGQGCGAAGVPNQCAGPADAGGANVAVIDGPITYDAGAPVEDGSACTPGQVGAVSGGQVVYCEMDDTGTTFPAGACSPSACLSCMTAACPSIDFGSPPSAACVTGAEKLFNYFAGCGPDRSSVPMMLVSSCGGSVLETIEQCKNGCENGVNGPCSFY